MGLRGIELRSAVLALVVSMVLVSLLVPSVSTFAQITRESSGSGTSDFALD